ncbi:MAG: PorT family protein [Flavobacteriales bacterium]|nr:PorT family protein [Flavobacteriales bacterium]MCB9204552.1 PorT family protein [Flavobacteriales bacterium]
MRNIVFLFLLLPLVGFGQGFGGGLYAGISTTQVTGDNIGGFNKVGAWGGSFTDYRFTPRSTLQLELSFIQKGSRQAPTVKNDGILYVHNQNILEIPVLYKWYGIKNMSIEMGLQAGIILSTVERGNTIPTTTNNPLFKPAEFSGAAGLSYYFWKNKIEVNMRYANSILSLKGNRDWWMNHVFAFSVRYWFKTTLDRDKIEATKKKNAIDIKVETGGEED